MFGHHGIFRLRRQLADDLRPWGSLDEHARAGGIRRRAKGRTRRVFHIRPARHAHVQHQHSHRSRLGEELLTIGNQRRTAHWLYGSPVTFDQVVLHVLQKQRRGPRIQSDVRHVVLLIALVPSKNQAH